jgi:hypothetical protein
MQSPPADHSSAMAKRLRAGVAGEQRDQGIAARAHAQRPYKPSTRRPRVRAGCRASCARSADRRSSQHPGTTRIGDPPTRRVCWPPKAPTTTLQHGDQRQQHRHQHHHREAEAHAEHARGAVVGAFDRRRHRRHARRSARARSARASLSQRMPPGYTEFMPTSATQ